MTPVALAARLSASSAAHILSLTNNTLNTAVVVMTVLSTVLLLKGASIVLSFFADGDTSTVDTWHKARRLQLKRE